jgi:hypothetical protein
VAIGGAGLYALTQVTGTHVNQPCLGNVLVESECNGPAYQNGQ